MKSRTGYLLMLLAVASTGNATEADFKRQGFFWGAGLGGAYLDRTFDTTNAVDIAEGLLYMEFFGGYAVNPHLAIGLELSGWTIEPDSDTYTWNPYWPPDNERSEEPQGEGLMQVLVFTRIYPYEDQGLFLKLGAGALDHWLKTDAGLYRDYGWSTVAGIGWDVHLSKNWSITPTLSYSYGKAGSQTHQAVSASLGFLWHQWKGPDRFAEYENGSW